MLAPKYNNQKSEITSYNYEDIAEGTGIRRFYAGISETSTITSYLLLQNALYGYPQVITAQSRPFVLSAFNSPRVVQGTAYIDFSTTAQAFFSLKKDNGTASADNTDIFASVATDGNAATLAVTMTALADNVYISGFTLTGNSNDSITVTIKKNGNLVLTSTSSTGTISHPFVFVPSDYADIFNTGDTILVETSGAGTIKKVAGQTDSNTLASMTTQEIYSGSDTTFKQITYYENLGNVVSTSSGTASLLVSMDIAQTQFKIEEKLVLFAGTTGTLACDPVNRDAAPFTAATNHTNLNLYVPFKLDL